MEDVLDLYSEAYDEKQPQVCFDEKSYQLVSETRLPLPAKPGETLRYDYEYKREGVRNLFVFFEAHRGWRHISVTEQRTKLDFAEQMRWLVEERYPTAEKIRVVLDNLNTHRLSTLYEAFPAEQARRIVSKLEFHYTPKHASWLNMVEIELSVLSRQCLDRRLGSESLLCSETAAYEARRNAEGATVNWRFTTGSAREKFSRFYPSKS